MTERVRLGQQRPTRMRRIGSQHMIVLPMQVAKVMSVGEVENTLRVARQQEQATQQQLDRHRAFIADLEQQLAHFRGLPIERDEDDPEVPQPEPKHEPAIGNGSRIERVAHPLHEPRTVVLSDA
jgi:hypothetical protein